MSTAIDDSYIPDIDYDDFEGSEGNRRVIFVALLAVLILVIGALAYWRLAIYSPGHQTLKQIENTNATYSMGTQTMNLSDGSLVQVEVVMKLTTLANTTEFSQKSAQLNNVEIYVFSSTTFQQLLTPQGKTEVQNELVAKFQHILGPVDKLPQLTAVYFKNLVESAQGAPVS